MNFIVKIAILFLAFIVHCLGQRPNIVVFIADDLGWEEMGPYAPYEVQEWGLDRWSKIVDQPIMNGDSAYTMVSKYMPHPFGPIASSLEERIEWTETFFKKAFARPDFIG